MSQEYVVALWLMAANFDVLRPRPQENHPKFSSNEIKTKDISVMDHEPRDKDSFIRIVPRCIFLHRCIQFFDFCRIKLFR